MGRPMSESLREASPSCATATYDDAEAVVMT